MKRILAVALLAAATPAHAADNNDFFKLTINDAWMVFGTIWGDGTNANCYGELSYKDGSLVHFRKDLVDGELYFWIRNNDWSMEKGKDDEQKLRLNLLNNNNRVVDGGNLNWSIWNKNTIAIRELEVKSFTKYAWLSSGLRLIMPTVQNLAFPFPGRQLIDGISKCMASYKEYKNKNPDKIPDLTISPEDVKKKAREQI